MASGTCGQDEDHGVKQTYNTVRALHEVVRWYLVGPLNHLSNAMSGLSHSTMSAVHHQKANMNTASLQHWTDVADIAMAIAGSLHMVVW